MAKKICRLSIILTVIFLSVLPVQAQKFSSQDYLSTLKEEPPVKLSAHDYIQIFKEDAIKEMLLNKIPASIVLAQALFESDNGNSELARNANNHFGIKCKRDWIGESYSKDDEERNECFRKYNSVLESYTDHSIFLKTRERYVFLFEIPLNNYKAWCQGLKDAGYATDPNYAKRLIDIIEKYKLYEFDKQASLEKPIFPKLNNDQIPELSLKVVYQYNSDKFIITKEGDSFFKIATEYDIELEKLLIYNDLKKGDPLKLGVKLYLEPKKEQAKEPFHVVETGESLHEIAQKHGIKLSVLCKNNYLKPNHHPKKGEILYLREKKPFSAIPLTSENVGFNQNF